eukprot:2841104-Rhodomonas_salina.1
MARPVASYARAMPCPGSLGLCTAVRGLGTPVRSLSTAVPSMFSTDFVHSSTDLVHASTEWGPWNSGRAASGPQEESEGQRGRGAAGPPSHPLPPLRGQHPPFPIPPREMDGPMDENLGLRFDMLCSTSAFSAPEIDSSMEESVLRDRCEHACWLLRCALMCSAPYPLSALPRRAPSIVDPSASLRCTRRTTLAASLQIEGSRLFRSKGRWEASAR